MSFASTAVQFSLEGGSYIAAQLLAFYGVNMIALIVLMDESRIVVTNTQAGIVQQIFFVYGLEYEASHVRIFRYTPGVRGQLARILSTNPSEIYTGEGNTIIATYGGQGDIGIFDASRLPPLTQIRTAHHGQFSNLI